MHFSFTNSAVWQLLKEFDFIGWFVLIGLMLFSVFCVAIIAFKYITFKRHTASLEALVARIKNVRTFSEMIALSKEFKGTIGGKFLMLNLSELKSILDNNMKKKSSTPEATPTNDDHASLSTKDVERLEMMLGQNIENTIYEEESYFPVLNIGASVGTLMGLFGTIWGLIRTFVDISQEKSADIATVAPGMAVALITTLAGLVVAIPSLISYIYLANKVKLFEKQLNEIAERFLSSAKQAFLK